MKDAFGRKLKVGDKVVYSTGRSPGGTVYNYGEIVRLVISEPKPNVSYYPPDRVEIKVIRSNVGYIKFEKNPLVYTSNVVLYLENIDG